MMRGDGKCLRNVPNLSFVSILVCIRAGYHLSVTLPLPSEPLMAWNVTSGRNRGQRLLSQQASLLSTAATDPTLPTNRNLYAKLEELICGYHVFICSKLFLVFFLMKVLPLDF